MSGRIVRHPAVAHAVAGVGVVTGVVGRDRGVAGIAAAGGMRGGALGCGAGCDLEDGEG